MSLDIDGDFDAAKSLETLRSGRNTVDVAIALGVTHAHLVRHLYRVSPTSQYTVFQIQKRSGKQRTIAAPSRQLKFMQRQLARILDLAYQPTKPAHGFIAERSVVTNAAPHLRSRWVLNLDLKDFFGTIHFGRVRGLLMAQPFNLHPKVAACLATLATREGALPQGAPTSPVLSNLICRGLDRELRAHAFRHHCTFTRYADDLTFSTRRFDFPASLASRRSPDGKTEVGSALSEVILRHGFQINPDKSRLLSRQNRQEVTGIVTNARSNVPREYVRHLRSIMHAWRTKTPESLAQWFQHHRGLPRGAAIPPIAQIVRGMVSYVRMVRGPEDVISDGLTTRFGQILGLATDSDAVWVIESTSRSEQGTGFFLEGTGFVTAAHVLHPDSIAVRPDGTLPFPVSPTNRHSVVDLAICAIPPEMRPHKLVPSLRQVQQGDRVTLLGYPRHAPGRGIRREPGVVVALIQRNGLTCFAISPSVIPGNSGGPVLDRHGLVVGIATKGARGLNETNGENVAVPIAALSRLLEWDAQGQPISPAPVTTVHSTPMISGSSAPE